MPAVSKRKQTCKGASVASAMTRAQNNDGCAGIYL